MPRPSAARGVAVSRSRTKGALGTVARAYCSRRTVPGRSPGSAAQGTAQRSPSGATITVVALRRDVLRHRLPDQATQRLGGRARLAGDDRTPPPEHGIVDRPGRTEVNLPHRPAPGQHEADVARGLAFSLFPLDPRVLLEARELHQVENDGARGQSLHEPGIRALLEGLSRENSGSAPAMSCSSRSFLAASCRSRWSRSG